MLNIRILKNLNGMIFQAEEKSPEAAWICILIRKCTGPWVPRPPAWDLAWS